MTEIAAGWYTDPSSPMQVRYWDGSAWTHQVAPHPAVPPPAPARVSEDLGPGSALHYLVPVGRSWQAVAAPWIGLAALVLFWVPAVGLGVGATAVAIGIAALRRARSGGHGSGRAIVGIVLGAVGAIVGAIVTFVVVTSWLGT
ncbi:DUF2510 domain-containing protein [Demequina sp. NBRC 110053]|uniref:DUF2510 domain-containing protein n=1 Tax=Demequina sp. NBRC 110053 TaxID=1570342 RepID=UPI000A06255D|nr:DUF2510 domain-containing protein [Demequina sp. NBRC 110053]